jgi:phosphate-selective porin OprO/OprP
MSHLKRALLGGAAAILLSSGAHAAAPATSNDALAQRLADLQAQLDDLNNAMADLKRGQSAQYADIQSARAQDSQVTFKNGRPTFKTADGNFSVSLRTLLQFDMAYYGDGNLPAGVDFSSGTNFRRARLGFSGTLFRDWQFEFLYDLGGSGIEGATVSSAYIQYDGLAPVHFRIGAFPPPESFEDSTSASDLLFLERAQPVDLQRTIAGSDGRQGAQVFAYDDNYFASVAYTGGLTGDAAVFDEQQALVGRFAYRLVKTADANFALGANSSWVFKLGDTAAGVGSPHAARFRERPELNVDSTGTRLIDTGTIDAASTWDWGVEAAGNWHSLYGQGGYFGFDITRRASLLPDPSFEGWYVQASWILTGESKVYRPERGAYGSPTPEHQLTFGEAGLGAWELVARYSDLNLDFHEGLAGFATPVGGVRGGEQRIVTAGINWYPNTAIRFLFHYQHTDVSRLNGAGLSIGGNQDALSLRAQLSL